MNADDLTPIQVLARDHLSGIAGRGDDGVHTLHAVVAYLRMICPNEDDILIFSESHSAETNVGKLFAITPTHAAILAFGRQDRGEFKIEGPILPLCSIVAVRFRPDSTVWADRGGEGPAAPSVAVEFTSGDVVTIGRNADYRWSPRTDSVGATDDVQRDKLFRRILA